MYSNTDPPTYQNPVPVDDESSHSYQNIVPSEQAGYSETGPVSESSSPYHSTTTAKPELVEVELHEANTNRYTFMPADKINVQKETLTVTQKSQGNDNNEQDDKPKKAVDLDDMDINIQPLCYIDQGIEVIPSWGATLGLGFQVYLMMVATSVSLPLYIMSYMCVPLNEPLRANLVSTFVFVSGIVTILQSSFGTRLPIVQGGSSAFMIPTLAILSLPNWLCPKGIENNALVVTPDQREAWQMRMREIQGAIIMASLFQVAIGALGVAGLFLKMLTPITIACSVTMIGLSLFSIASRSASSNWWVSVSTIILITIFSQYLRDVNIPIPFTSSPKREGPKRFRLFQRLPILLGMVVMWFICWILTLANVLPATNSARTDLEKDVFIRKESEFFYVPYPFQWGTPTLSIGAILGILAGVISGIVESIGDYYATARIVGARAPPIHAINRGIFVEGIGCILAGMWGTGNGTTSYSENIGAIGITQVGSRRVIQIGGLLMIIFSLFCKMNAFFVTIPAPISGAFLMVIFGTLTAAGLSNLRGVDLNSPRNMFVIGFSMFFALSVSQWMYTSKYKVETGSEGLDQMIYVFLSTGMFLGGFIAFVLDNTVPGTREERGLVEWDKLFAKDRDMEEGDGEPKPKDDAYDLPFIMRSLRNMEASKWIPMSPTFEQGKYEDLFRNFFHPMRRVFRLNK